MRFGFFSLMTQRDRSVSARQLYRELVERVKLVEVISFDIAWLFALSQPVHVSCYMALPAFPQRCTLHLLERVSPDVLPMLERQLGGLATIARPAR